MHVGLFDCSILQNELMHFPVWIDLKGQDTVPETLHHVVSVNWILHSLPSSDHALGPYLTSFWFTDLRGGPKTG